MHVNKGKKQFHKIVHKDRVSVYTYNEQYFIKLLFFNVFMHFDFDDMLMHGAVTRLRFGNQMP